MICFRAYTSFVQSLTFTHTLKKGGKTATNMFKETKLWPKLVEVKHDLTTQQSLFV